jgi:signal transduction histidine kinase/ligand-binding sensor domain-containing protein
MPTMGKTHRRVRFAVAPGTILACLLLWCPCALALDPALDVSQYAHTAWKIRDGFAKGSILSIAQTPDGYLWVGTAFGLSRFDGVRNVPWQPPPGEHLPSSTITRLVAARDGTLWVGTTNGLASWKNGELTRYGELAGLGIRALVEDHEGSMWVGTNGPPDGKLCEIRNGSVRCHPEMGGVTRGVFGLYEDDKGNLWVGLEMGVWRWRPGPPEFYAVPGLPSGRMQSMVDSDDGALLIATTDAIVRLAHGQAEVVHRYATAKPGFRFLRMLRDHDGGLWVAPASRGIVHIHQGRTDVFSELDGLSGDDIYDLFEDREGDIWVASVNGLDRFRELPVVTYSRNQGLSDIPWGAVLAARDGSVWFGTLDGLNRLNQGQVTVYRQHGASAGVREIVGSGLPDEGLGSLLQDSRGRIWVSTLTGIGHLENDRFIPTAAPGGLVDSVTEDTSGNLWIANRDLGLFRLSPRNEFLQIPWAAFGRKDSAFVLAPDPLHGGLWLGFSRGGVSWFHDDHVQLSYSGGDGLGEGRVYQLRFDGEGALWIATEGGLGRLKNGRIATLTSNSGLPCDAVQWTMEDDAQSVWLMMPCGLLRVARSELEARASAADNAARTIHATVFDSSDGLRGLAVVGDYTPRVGKSEDGKLWFSVPDGISVVDPHHLPFNKLPPPVHIEKVTADREAYEPTSPAGGSLRLPALIRDLQIDYTALSLVAPEKVRFRYKLEGWDRDWQDAGTRRQAFYTHLSPRKYHFQVMACNNSGVWNEASETLDFSIAPTYYQTRWFQLSCVAAFMVLLSVLYRVRLRQVARQFNLRLEERVSERTRIARDLHDTLLQSFHGLLLRFQTASELFPARPAEAKQTLDSAIEQAAQAITEGRDAVQGLRSSTVVTNDLALAINTLGEELAGGETNPNAAEFHVGVEGTPRDLHPILRDEVYRIAGEALRNAFRHAEARRIEVEIRYDERQFRLRLRDDGKGIDSKLLNDDERPGHYGMRGMRERAKLLGGKLTVWSEVETGTEVELGIPAANAYATADGRRRSWLAEKFAGKLVEKDTERKS